MMFVLTFLKGPRMQATTDRNLLYHKLHQMMDRLCSPDLTVAESKVLRPQIEDLIARLDRGEKRAQTLQGSLAGSSAS
jgi:hypothetical protein